MVVNKKNTAYKQKKKDHFEINSFLKVKKRQTFLIGVFDVELLSDAIFNDVMHDVLSEQ